MSFCLHLDGTAGNEAATPDSAGLSVTGDIDLRVKIQVDDLTPAATMALVSKFDTGPDYSWSFLLQSDGALIWAWSEDGSAVDFDVSTVQIANYLGPREPAWVRVTHDVDNGSSQNEIEFFISTDDQVTWTQIGATVVNAGTTSIFDSAAEVTVGLRNDGGFPFDGQVYAFELYEGIDGTQRASVDFTDGTQGWVVGDDSGDTGTDDQSNVWTLGGSATISAQPSNIQGVLVLCQAALGFDVYSQTTRWTDLTDDLRSVDFSRGRQYELDRIEAGTMTVTLGNNHGNYNSHNTQGAYYPNVKPTVPIRLRAVYDGVVYPLWSGFVERWPVSFPAKVDSVVQVQCVDLFKLLALAKAAAADRESAVDALSPEAHWRFGDTSDRTGNGHTLTFSGSPTAGDADGAWESDEATTFDGSDDFATVATPSTVIRAGSVRSWEFWVYPDSAGSGLNYVMDIENSGGFDVAHLSYNHTLNKFFMTRGSFPAAADEWHHVVFTQDPTGGTTTAYLDGVLMVDTSYSEPSGGDTLRIGATADEGDHWTGEISEVAVYPTVLTAAQVQSLYDAKTEAYIDQLTSARIAYLLDNFTYPISPVQNLEAGQTTMDGPNSPTGGSLLSAVQAAAETENGIFFIAGDGSARFHDRDYRSTEQSASSGTFGPNNLGIFDIDLALDDERIFNEVKVAPDDNSDPFISRDEDSITTHGRRTFERTIYPADANEALDAANWLRASYAEAATRIGTMQLRPGDDTALWPVILAAEISNRYTINQTTEGDDYSDDHYLEAISMRISREKTWEVAWQLSPVSSLVAFILDDDVLGLLDGVGVLGY